MSHNPSTKGMYTGTFSTEKALNDSLNPSKYQGGFALVGSGPYRVLYAEGSNWVDHDLRPQGDDLLDPNDITVRDRLGVNGKNYVLSSLEAPVIIPPRLQVGVNGAIQFGTLVTGVTVTFSATQGTGVTCTTSAAFFTSSAVDVNKYISLPTGEWAQVTAFTSSTIVTVSILTAGPALKGTVGPYSNWYYGHGTPAVYGHPGYPNVARAALGCWMYFKADALYSGSAADTYWVVMRSPMTGTAFNTTPDNGFGRLPMATPQRIVSPAMGEQAHAAGEVFIGGVTSIPFGSVGPNGNILVNLAGAASTSSLTKYIVPYYGNSSSGRPSATTQGGFTLRTRWTARGSHCILGLAQGWGGEVDSVTPTVTGGLVEDCLIYTSSQAFNIQSLGVTVRRVIGICEPSVHATGGMLAWQRPVVEQDCMWVIMDATTGAFIRYETNGSGGRTNVIDIPSFSA